MSCTSLRVLIRPPTRAGNGSTASTSTCSSMSTRWWRSALRRDADVQSCCAGGSHFEKLIKQQGTHYDSKHDETEEALHVFWLSRGVKEEAYRSRLVGMGDTLASSVSARSCGEALHSDGSALSPLFSFAFVLFCVCGSSMTDQYKPKPVNDEYLFTSSSGP